MFISLKLKGERRQTHVESVNEKKKRGNVECGDADVRFLEFDGFDKLPGSYQKPHVGVARFSSCGVRRIRDLSSARRTVNIYCLSPSN